jgi:hypothetical protein
MRAMPSLRGAEGEEAIQGRSVVVPLECFAALAMTATDVFPGGRP